MNIIAAVIGEFLRKSCVCIFSHRMWNEGLYTIQMKIPVTHVAQWGCRPPPTQHCGRLGVTDPAGTGDACALASDPLQLHPPMQSVLNPSVPRLKPDDSTQTGSLQKPCKSFMSSSPFAPAHGAEQRAPHSLLVHISTLSARHQIKSAANWCTG